MSIINGFEKYAKHGIIGVILALIALVALIGFGTFKIVTNHMHDNTKALSGVEKVIEGNTEVLRSLQQTIIVNK